MAKFGDVMSCGSNFLIISQRKAFYWQRIPETASFQHLGMMTEKNVIYQNNDYNLSEPYFRFRSFIWLAQTKKEFQRAMTTAKTAENRVDK